MFKKVLILLLALTITFIGLHARAEDKEMYYVAIYDKSLNHITNVTDIKYNITKRVYDFDTSSFEGIVDKNIENGFIFSFCSSRGYQLYSGFMKNIKQKDEQVSFKGVDLRTLFDTDITLDYTRPHVAYYSYYLFDIFKDVSNAVKLQQTPGPVDVIVSYPENTSGDPATWISTSGIANYAYQYLVKNAYKFLKVYLSYYNYYLTSHFNPITKKVVVTFKKNTNSKTIKLDDFTYQKTTTDVAINKAIAVQRYNGVEQAVKAWIPTDINYYNMMPSDKKTQTTGRDYIAEKWAGPADNREMGYALAVDIITETGEYWNTAYFQVGNAAVERPDNLKQKAYYLGSDNQLYEEYINPDKIIYPVKTKVFENDYFNMAQYDAIAELVNSRYNENIIITDDMAPINIKDIELYEMITVYDKNGTSVTMPVSEIEMSNDNYSIKLGFKKTLFTEVIKK